MRYRRVGTNCNWEFFSKDLEVFKVSGVTKQAIINCKIVTNKENMSISALKNKKLDIRKKILGAVKEAKIVIEKRLKK